MVAIPDDGDGIDDVAMRARLEALSSTLEGRRAGAERASRDGMAAPNGVGQAVGLGFRVMSEFVAAVVVGAGIGWAIDKGLHTSPAALIVFVALGTAAGFWNVYRMAAKPTAPPPG